MTEFIKIDDWDYDKKMELELEYQLSLSIQQRYAISFRLTRAKNEYLLKNGLKKVFEIILRTE